MLQLKRRAESKTRGRDSQLPRMPSRRMHPLQDGNELLAGGASYSVVPHWMLLKNFSNPGLRVVQLAGLVHAQLEPRQIQYHMRSRQVQMVLNQPETRATPGLPDHAVEHNV